MSEARINGYQMYYETHGSGQPFVMIHGGLGGGEGCAGFVEHHAAALSPDYQMIVYDRRSAGKSDNPDSGYSIDNCARDLRGLLEHLGVTHAHILGSSAGGPIALRFALEHPEMTDTLILINTMSYVQESERAVRQRELDQMRSNEAEKGREASIAGALEARWPGIRAAEPDRFQRLYQLNLERYDGIAQTMQSYLDIRDSLESRLAELTMPTLVVHGDEDSRIPVECGRQLHRGIAGSEWFMVPGAEHGLMGNEPALMRKVILEFLSRRAIPAGSAAD